MSRCSGGSFSSGGVPVSAPCAGGVAIVYSPTRRAAEEELADERVLADALGPHERHRAGAGVLEVAQVDLDAGRQAPEGQQRGQHELHFASVFS